MEVPEIVYLDFGILLVVGLVSFAKGMQTRAMSKGKKGEATPRKGQGGKIQELTKPGPLGILEDGEIPSSQSFSGTGLKKTSRKRKPSEFRAPQVPKRGKGIYSSTSRESSDRSDSRPRFGALDRLEKEEKIEQMFDWFQRQQDRESYRSSSRHSQSRSRSRSRSSRSSSHHSRRSSSSRHSRTHSRSRSKEWRRREHELSTSPSKSPSQGRDVSDVLRRDILRGDGASEPPQLEKGDTDPLEQRIFHAVKECAPKPVVGPAVSANVGTLMDWYVSKPEFPKVMKLTEKYPRPENVPSLVTPEVPQDVDKTIDYRVVKEDKKMRNDQLCTAASLASLGAVLDIIREVKDKDPRLVQAGEMVLDSITMLGLVHSDFSSVRLKAFKLTVHPSYGEVFTAKPNEPDMLMGKTPIAEQVKSVDELNKLKAKLKKPEPSQQNQKPRDFRKRGEYLRNQFKQNRPYYPRKREERKRRYYSPKGNYRKGQQDNKQEDRKPTSRRN